MPGLPEEAEHSSGFEHTCAHSAQEHNLDVRELGFVALLYLFSMGCCLHDSNRVPNSKPGRESMELEIFGMAGVPEGLRPGGVGKLYYCLRATSNAL